jgi:carbon-monoxide dehydrogenase medium subunit
MTVPETLDLLSEYGDEAKVLAGGQSLVPMLAFRLALPAQIIDINRLPELDAPRRNGAGWHIPALVRQRAVERSPEIGATVPLLRDAIAQVAHPQIRNRGTVCGSLAHADPAAELPTVMMALDARMTVASRTGVRVIDAADFFVFHLTTVLEPDELLLGVDIADPPPRTYSSFQEFAPRRGDFCLAGVAAVVTFDVDGLVSGCRLVAAGVSSTPHRLTAAEAAIVGTRLGDGDVSDAESAARREVSPTGDVHADEAYRRHLVAVLTKRALHAVRTNWEADRV